MPRAREARLLFADCSRRGAGLAAPGSDPGGDLAPPDDDRALLLTPLLQALHALFSGRCCSWRDLRARAVGCPSDCPRRVNTAMEPRVEAASTPRGQPEGQIGGGCRLGVAIRCTIMVFRRLWAPKVTCLSTSASRLRHIVVVIYIYGKPITLPPGIWRGSEHHLRYCWSRSGGSGETPNGSIKHVTFAT